MTVAVNNSTIANAGPDQIVCSSTIITLAANATTGANWTGWCRFVQFRIEMLLMQSILLLQEKLEQQ
jgi:hypothetical protein